MSVFCPQYAEHGWGLRNPAGGGGSWLVVITFWLTPTTLETTLASDDGIVSMLLASRTLWPFTM